MCVRCRHKDASLLSNLNEALVYKDHMQSIAVSAVISPNAESVAGAGSVTDDRTAGDASLPSTLSYLVLFWEELCNCVSKQIAEGSVSMSVGPSNAATAVPVKKRDVSSAGVKKVKDDKSIALRGNLFGAAALGDDDAVLVASVVASSAVCELCGAETVHPVTYHMRHAHPGCGHPAGGHGYNSGGNFCGGWAGSCGDGGIGGSTWYLMCDSCRSKYLREKRDAGRKERSRDKAVAPAKATTTTPVMVNSASSVGGPQWVVYSNAMFLLELAAGRVASSRQSGSTSRTEMLSSISETSVSLPEPTLPFVYLQLRGVQDSELTDSDDVWNARRASSDVRGARRDAASVLDRSVSDSSRHRPLSTYDAAGRAADPAGGAASGKSLFQRSVSEMGSIVHAPEPASTAHQQQHSCSDLGDGLSLVKRPSTDMLRLIRSLSAVDSVAAYMNQQSVVSFVTQHHELDRLRRMLTHAVRHAACRTHALLSLNWLLRSVSQTSCLHDLMWHFVASLTVRDDHPLTDADQDVAVCCHPVTDVSFAGEMSTKPLVTAFHCLLQSVSDVLMHIPAGSASQRMAVRCWSIQFHPADHTFLHHSHVFSHISSILSSAEDTRPPVRHVTDTAVSVEHLTDLTVNADIKMSSRQAMVGGLTDGSTETFWESGDDERNRTKTLAVNCSGLSADWRLRVICIHVDNARDIGNKVSTVLILAGASADSVEQVRQVQLEQRHVGWVSAWIGQPSARYVRVELQGPDNTVRVRQLKLLGDSADQHGCSMSNMIEQQCECISETLSVFRLLTSLVFGQLVSDTSVQSNAGDHQSDVDLKEHMVGILFSHSGELTRLQRQVCAHIVSSIKLETARVRSAWQSESSVSMSDSYCFELLSLLLALSGSAVGRRFVSQQKNLVEDLVSLLHTASARVQRQVVSLLRRTLTDITPWSFASLLGVVKPPATDLATVARSAVVDSSECYQQAVLDVFLACIAKALSVHVKSRSQSAGLTSKSVSVTSNTLAAGSDTEFWWLRGCVSSQLADSIIKLLMDMSEGWLGADWAAVTKCAVGGAIMSLSRSPASVRSVDQCLQSPVIWLALAALCVLSSDHVDQLSTGRWSHVATVPMGNPTCDNHDDGETPATIMCGSGCGNLCGECDRVLHLSRRHRLHQRQVRRRYVIMLPVLVNISNWLHV